MNLTEIDLEAIRVISKSVIWCCVWLSVARSAATLFTLMLAKIVAR